MKKFLFLVPLMAGLAGILWFGSCQPVASTPGGSSTVPGTAGTYQGAGSRWNATFTTTTFVLEKFPTVTSTSADLTVNGTYTEFTTGFRKLTVTSATGSGAPAAGAQAYGFEVPGFAFFLKPIGSSTSEPIIMLNAGACPGGTGFNANWIIAKFDPGMTLDDTKDNFGSAVFNTTTPASSDATINKLSAVTASSLGSSAISFDHTTCASGKLTFNSGNTVDMFFTTNGGALVHSSNGGSSDNTIFAAPKHTGAVTQSEIAATYSGILFDQNASGDKISPVKFTLPTTGDGSGSKISDVETDALVSGQSVVIGNFAAHAHSAGLFTLALDPTGENGRLSCTYFTLASKKIMACNGYGSNADKKPFFILGKSR